MQKGRRSQQHNLSDGTSVTANRYNPIATLNSELNSDQNRRLLKKVDTMREILRMEKIPLPQIVVVGDQSVDCRAPGFRSLLTCLV